MVFWSSWIGWSLYVLNVLIQGSLYSELDAEVGLLHEEKTVMLMMIRDCHSRFRLGTLLSSYLILPIAFSNS